MLGLSKTKWFMYKYPHTWSNFWLNNLIFIKYELRLYWEAIYIYDFVHAF